MKNIYIVLILIGLYSCPPETENTEINIIPKPLIVEKTEDSFTINKRTKTFNV